VSDQLDQLDLFGEDPQLPNVPVLSGTFGALDAKWTAYRGVHKPCSDCTELIHQLGADKAPFPMAATRRRKGPNDDRFLCPAHAQVRKELDDTQERLRKERQKAEGPQTSAERATWAKRRARREGMS
jgi:hypothetical protein